MSKVVISRFVMSRNSMVEIFTLERKVLEFLPVVHVTIFSCMLCYFVFFEFSTPSLFTVPRTGMTDLLHRLIILLFITLYGI